MNGVELAGMMLYVVLPDGVQAAQRLIEFGVLSCRRSGALQQIGVDVRQCVHGISVPE